jgi:hypothetical protein
LLAPTTEFNTNASENIQLLAVFKPGGGPAAPLGGPADPRARATARCPVTVCQFPVMLDYGRFRIVEYPWGIPFAVLLRHPLAG